MHKFNVIFEVFNGNGTKQTRPIMVEAGNKKLATLRAMGIINKMDEFANLFKNVIRVEEVV